jgi:hypothetical protein
VEKEEAKGDVEMKDGVEDVESEIGAPRYLSNASSNFQENVAYSSMTQHLRGSGPASDILGPISRHLSGTSRTRLEFVFCVT